MKKDKLGPVFAENIEQAERKSRLVDNDQLKESIVWGTEKESLYTSKQISPWRVLPLYLFFLISFLALSAKAFSLQVIQGGSFLNEAEGNHVRIVTTHAPRGAILDRNGKILSQSKPGFSVVIDPQSWPENYSKEIKELAKLLKVRAGQIEKKIKASNGSDLIQIRSNIDHATAISLQAQEEKFPGVLVEINPLREYLSPKIFSPIIGYTSETSEEDLKDLSKAYQPGDKVGRVGAEAAFEDRLRGANGYDLIRVDAGGKRAGTLVHTEAVSGNDITLSIDSDLQKFIYERVKNAMKVSKGKSAAVVAMNPKTGEILSMVSFPSFDNNLFAKGLTQNEFTRLFNDPNFPLLNRALSSGFPPGSTFKLVMAAAGLETGTVSPETKFVDTGFLRLGTITFQNWLWREKHRTDGTINITRALARSNDIYFFRLGQKLGVDNIDKYAALFGLGEKTGVELPGEAAGLIPSPTWKQETKGLPWYPGETLNVSIGQGDTLVTPLQLASVTSAIANGGNLLRPTILPTKTADYQRKNFLKPKTLGVIVDGMIGNQRGDGNTGYLFHNFPIPTAGKTGSAETGLAKKIDGWYTVFAPVKNPEIVITTLVERGNAHGGEIWGPEVKKILQWWFEHR
ncbi:MAG: penicillin-binding protein 2 [bacterium]|nr:penicillin-binding protein 2 [bacterium]